MRKTLDDAITPLTKNALKEYLKENLKIITTRNNDPYDRSVDIEIFLEDEYLTGTSLPGNY